MVTSVVKNDHYEILTPSGWSSFDGVIKNSKKGLVTVDSINHTLSCTPNHRILTKDGFQEARALVPGVEIITSSGSELITRISFDNSTNDVYDVKNVQLKNTYFTNNIASHNCVEFLGSSGTLIAGWKLKELVHSVPLESRDGLNLYRPPEKDHTYACVVDVGRGKGLDYSAFHIVDVTSMPYRQACVYRSNKITPLDYAEVIYRTCTAYNTAFVLVEINDIGGQVADSLHFDFEYENVLYTETAGRLGKRVSSGFGTNVDRGIRTTKTVKSVGCSILKLLVEQNQLEIIDQETIGELSTFSKKGQSYEAEEGKHDDLTMCLVLFAWLSDQQYFKDMTNINTLMKLRDKTEEEIMADMLPFGFVSDGRTEEISEEPIVVSAGQGDSWLFKENNFI